VAGARVDHCVEALQSALALHDKAPLLGLGLGVGIAVGPAVLGRGADDSNVAVRGVSTNLAARLQSAAGAGEILLSDEAHRRVEPWLAERGLVLAREELELKGFDGRQVVYRLPAPTA
jgi:class 3 adenylate cyclase